jgi:hypothetical protein
VLSGPSTLGRRERRLNPPEQVRKHRLLPKEETDVDFDLSEDD